MSRVGVTLLTVLIALALFGCDRPPIEPTDSPDAGAVGPDAGLDAGSPTGCGPFSDPSKQTLTTDERVATVLSTLTLTEKIEQMAGFDVGADLFATPDNEHANIRGFRFRDGPRGVRLESGTATCFPASVARGASWNLDLEERVGEAMGREVRGLGHNLLLAPCINTLRHPGWGRAQETYGEDPWLLGKMGAAFTRGTQRQVPACVKHYAGNNIEDTRMTNNAVMDEQILRENYTRQFRMVIEEADVACVMSAYNRVNGQYCSENNHLLREVLKDEWGFDGFVVSDWFAAQSTVESAVAGLDVEMPWITYYASLESAVLSGQVPEEAIDEAVTRILRTKFKYGFALLDETWETEPESVESPEHIALAREAGRKGMVLLRNQGGVLPLDRATVGTIAVVGAWADEPRLGDNGSSAVTPSYAITPYGGIVGSAGGDVTVLTSVDSSAAQGADVAVVVVALTQQDEGEAWNGGGDRDLLDLSADQEALIVEVSAMVETTIVIIEAGGPITMSTWGDSPDAIIMAWYAGMEAGNAMGDVLFGDLDFEGRLIQTWPEGLADEPLFGNHQAETEYAYYHGYRHFDHYGIEPLFPFGFGLSYTTFELSALSLPCAAVTEDGRMVVSVDVENTGTRAGVDVVQLYVAYPNTQATRRPAMELKGFARVELQAGEKKTVEIPVKIADLAYWDMGADGWIVEHVDHVVRVGHHARDLPLSAAFTVADEGQSIDTTILVDPVDPGPDDPDFVPSVVSVTFQVDMTGYDPDYLLGDWGGVYLQGEFNSWCGDCAPLTDADGDQIWRVTVPLAPGTYQYKYTTSEWMGFQEMVPSACDLDPDDEEYNRFVDVGYDDTVLPVHLFEQCPGDEATPPQAVDVTFQVDMAGLDTTDGVHLRGTFNGWCVTCAPLSDEDGDGIWTRTVPVIPGTWEYKFFIGGYVGVEEKVPAGCDLYPEDEYQNRYVVVADEPVLLPVHPFEACAEPGPALTKVTFRIDMAGIDTTGGVYLQAEFNDWCGPCEPLADADEDGVWAATVALAAGTYQYKYTTDGWDGLVETVPSACDLYPEDEYTNRYVVVEDVDLMLAIHTWETCP